MRSIRVSLLIYLVALLSLALGGFSFFIYENSRQRLADIYDGTQRMLQVNNEQTQARLQEHFDVTRKRLQVDFDDSLLLKAKTLVSRLATRLNFRWEAPLAATFAGLTTFPDCGAGNAALAYTLRSMTTTDALYTFRSMNASDDGLDWTVALRRAIPVRRESLQLSSSDVKLLEEDWSQMPEGTPATYFQLFNDQGIELQKSPSLGGDELRLDEEILPFMPVLANEFEDVTLSSGATVRQVTLKTPVTHLTLGPFRRRSGSPGVSRPRFFLAPADRDVSQLPIVYLLFAQSTKDLNEVLTDLQEGLANAGRDLEVELQQRLQSLEDQSQVSLASLRTKLLLTSLLAFSFAAIGVVGLVYRGLSPVQRITDAVSQVSEKHFELPLSPDEVPTELVPIVERLKKALASLEKAFNREKQAAADISHELRTPISALLATAQVCLRKSRSPEEYRAALENCSEIGQQLNVLVERLLTLARLDAGADSIRNVPVDVPELAAQCTELVRPLAEAHGLSLRLDRNGPAVLNTDPEKLREILTNLLHNAIQYNRPNGSVELSVEHNHGQVNLEVRDTGIGIPQEARTHLFERFYRVDPSRHSDTANAGLGLAIVKGYLDLMGGRIEVESVEGHGTTFRVVLPTNS